MTISALVRKLNLKHGSNTKATIYFRIRDKNKDFLVARELTIDPNHWSKEKQGYKIGTISERFSNFYSSDQKDHFF